MRQITIVGTGLIGGSFGLALRKYGFKGTIVGCDKPEVLTTAVSRGAIDRGENDVIIAARGSDLILFATPVGAILALFETLAPVLAAETLIADTGSTKQAFVERARMVFGSQASARVLPGHPMAGKESGGIERADADLFRQAVWLITPMEANGTTTPRQRQYLDLLEAIGARVMFIDPEEHDRLCAWISHLPQMISTAFTSVLREEFGNDAAISEIGGRALREMTRIAHSPYSMWRDIAMTNGKNLEDVMQRFEQQMAHLRENLRGPALREMFESANLYGRVPETPSPRKEDH